MSRVRPPGAAVAAALAGAVMFGFVLTSALVAVLPQFRFESQFWAVLPLFAWAGALGVDGVAALARRLAGPWRAAFGLFGAVPYALLLLVRAVAPDLPLPGWLAPVVAACAAAPFAVMAIRGVAHVDVTQTTATERTRRATALLGAAFALLALAASGPLITAALSGVLTASALGVAALRTGGLADAGRAWGPRQWAATVWGSVVVWACVILHGTTPWLISLWADLFAMLVAGAPLVAVSGVRLPALRRSSRA